MTFQTPWLLVLLLLVPVGIVLYLRSERRAARRRAAFAREPLLANVLPRRAGWRRHAPVALHGIAATALLVALARPQATVDVPVEQASVVVTTDRSGSMLAKDVAPSRLEAARDAAVSFVEAVPDELRVGAIAFNHEPTVLQSPTRDHDAVVSALRTVQPAGTTATGDALEQALRLIESARTGRSQNAPAAIVLLSDGKSVRGRDVLEVAREAREAKVPVFTVSLGTPTGTIETDGVRREVPPDPETMRRVAELTGGKAYSVDDAEELEEIYERLGSQLATEPREQEVTAAFAGGALLLVLLGAGASTRWFGRPL